MRLLYTQSATITSFSSNSAYDKMATAFKKTVDTDATTVDPYRPRWPDSQNAITSKPHPNAICQKVIKPESSNYGRKYWKMFDMNGESKFLAWAE